MLMRVSSKLMRPHVLPTGLPFKNDIKNFTYVQFHKVNKVVIGNFEFRVLSSKLLNYEHPFSYRARLEVVGPQLMPEEQNVIIMKMAEIFSRRLRPSQEAMLSITFLEKDLKDQVILELVVAPMS